MSEELRKRLIPAQAPLLGFLTALISAIGLAKIASAPPAVLAIMSAGLLAGSYLLHQREKGWMKKAAQLSFFCGVTLGLWIYTGWRAPQADVRPWAPPREFVGQVRLEQTFSRRADSKRLGGIATIVQVKPHLDYLLGHSVCVNLELGQSAPQVGELWRIRGVLQRISLTEQGFDRYLRSQGMVYRVGRGRWLSMEAPASLFRQWVQRAYDRLQTVLEKTIFPVSDLTQSTYSAMMLGNLGLLSSDQKNAYRLSGTLHLFAISGLHIGVIAIALFGIFRLMRIPSLFSMLLGLSLLGGYVVITGSASSAVRSWLMVAFVWVGQSLRRPPAPLASLVAAATLSLLIFPNLLWNIGFELSYGVVAALILFGAPLSVTLTQWLRADEVPEKPGRLSLRRVSAWLYEKMAQSLAMSLSASLVSIPLIIDSFGMISWLSIPLNCALIPPSSLAIVLGFIALGLGTLGVPWIPDALNCAAMAILSPLEAFVQLTIRLPYAYAEVTWRWGWLGLLSTLGVFAWLIMLKSSQLSYRLWVPAVWVAACVVVGALPV